MSQFGEIYEELELLYGDELPDIRQLLSMYGKVLINSFALKDESKKAIGRAIYLG